MSPKSIFKEKRTYMEKITHILKNQELSDEIREEIAIFYYHFKRGEFSQIGWDGHDSAPVEIESIFKTFEFIENLYLWLKLHANINMPCPKILPSVNGLCILSWTEETKQKLRLVICIEKENESYTFNYYGKINDPILGTKLFEIKKGLQPLESYKQTDFAYLFKMNL